MYRKDFRLASIVDGGGVGLHPVRWNEDVNFMEAVGSNNVLIRAKLN